MLKEMSVNLTENVLVIFCQYIIRFFTDFFLQCITDNLLFKDVNSEYQ